MIPSQNQLNNTNRTVNLEPKLMEVLVYLCQAAPEVVSTDDLIKRCWPNQFISDNPVHKCVAQLRKALDDDARKPRFIKTIPKKGYSVIGKVKDINHNQVQNAVVWQQGPPYLGSKPYQKQHQNIFFGRQKATSELKRLINQVDMDECRLLFIMGAQKVGKTSLIQAEILPFLQQPKTPFKMNLRAPLMYSLNASASRSANAFTESVKIHMGIESLEELAIKTQPGEKTPIIIDQLELLFDPEVNPQTAALLQVFIQLKQTNQFFFIIILGHEYYAKFMQQASFQELKKHACSYDVVPPNAEEIKAIIQQPIAAAGLAFEFDRKKFESLSTVITTDAIQLGNALPIISQAMRDLCLNLNDRQELTFAAYQKMGQMSGFLANKAEAIFASCSDSELTAFKQCLPALISLSADDQPHLVTLDAQLIKNSKAQTLIQRLIQADLISTHTISTLTYISLVHQSLLSVCPTFKNWLVQNRLALSVHSEIQRQSGIWYKNKKNPDYLLKNPYLLDHPNELNFDHTELTFLKASKRHQSKISRMKKILVGSLMMLLLAVSLLWVNNQSINTKLRNSQQSAEALNGFMIRDLKSKLQPIGQLELLEMVSNEVIKYYQQNDQKNPTKKIHHVNALNTLAEVYINQGKYDQARQLLTNAQSITQNNPGKTADSAIIFQLSQTNYWLGYIAYLQKNWSSAQQHWQAYLDNSKVLSTSEPEHDPWLLEQSYALNNLGSLMLKQNRLKEAERYITDSALIKHQLVKNHPNNSQYLADLSDTISWQASIMAKNSQLSEAKQLFYESSELAKQLVNYEPTNNQWNHRLALAWFRVSLSHFDLGELTQAKQFGEQSFSAFTQLIQTDPDNQAWNKTLINNAILLSKIHRYGGDLDMAQIYINQGLAYHGHYSKKIKSRHTAQHQFFRLQSESSLILNSLGQYKAALSLYESIYLPQTEGTKENVPDSAEQAIETAKRLLIHHELNQALNPKTNYQALQRAQQNLAQLSSKNNHKAVALQMRIATILKQEITPQQISFLNQINFKNPDYLKTEDLL